MNNLLVRADGGRLVGTGHLMRCLALVQAWRDRGNTAGFVMDPEAASFEHRLKGEGIPVFGAGTPVGSEGDKARTIAVARDVGASWVALDGYSFGPDYQDAIKSAGLKLLVIDDHGRSQRYSADVILDPNVGASETAYVHRPRSARLLLGTRYALLRREFRTRSERRVSVPRGSRKILVTLGGSDPENVTRHVLEALSKVIDSEREITVVIGPQNSHRESLEATAKSLPAKVALRADVSDMREVMDWADMAISAAGGTCWELAFLGIPTLLLAIANNQQSNQDVLVSRGAALSAGTSLETSLRTLIGEDDLRKKIAAQGQLLVDGKGADRASAILEAGLFRFRDATDADSRLLWDWANDPETRRVSFKTGAIPWDDHLHWVRQKLKDPGCTLWIVSTAANKPLAQVRFEAQGTEAVISFSIATEFRGRGWASEILRRASCEYFIKSKAVTIHAFIKPDNSTSLHVFEDAGYVPGPSTGILHPEAVHLSIPRDSLL
jgi:UDP-2,4-diacetamido-2,4,6-trideoxy-beta-L-altropyranose hydrolase